MYCILSELLFARFGLWCAKAGTETIFNDFLFFFYSSFLVAFSTLKTLDTIGNCQKPVFLLAVHVPQHVHKITNL